MNPSPDACPILCALAQSGAWVLPLLVFVAGCCVGSYLNVCGYRIPREISTVYPGSYCPACGTDIPARYNIPVLGWFILRGRAKCCGAPFSVRYSLIELATGILYLSLFVMFPPAIALVYATFCSALIVGMITDWDFFEIPDRVTLGSAGVGLIASFILPELHGTTSPWDGLWASLCGMGISAGILRAIALVGTVAMGEDAMGMGDVKLLAGVGAVLGWQAGLFTIALGSVLGAVIGVSVMLSQGKKWGSMTPIPFGPPLMLSAMIWIFGGKLWWNDHFAAFGPPFVLQ